MSEDQELLARIGQLAGHINLHKTQPSSSETTAHEQPSPKFPPSSVSRGHTAWKPPRPAPYQTTQGQNRGAYRPYSRNRSLVVNNGTVSRPSPSSSESPVSASTSESPQTAPAYVTTTGRHKQYINAAVLSKVTEQRKRAIEETQQQKAQNRNQWERQRMHQYVMALDAEQNQSVAQESPSRRGTVHEINIDGLRFQVLKDGAKLVRIFGEGTHGKVAQFGGPLRVIIDPIDTSRPTPKRTNVQGVTFVRSKQGNLYRSGVVRASKKTDKAKKNTSLCKSFTKTGTLDFPTLEKRHDISAVTVTAPAEGSTLT
ncbi:MAG: hypothetical protein Q9169_006587 [Polycauliona sp. 2 TL-2023]